MCRERRLSPDARPGHPPAHTRTVIACTITRDTIKGDGELPEGMLDMEQYRMVEGETLGGLLEQYTAAAERTWESVVALPDLDCSVPLPRTPWSPPETVHWSARRILLHLIRETAQHAGHADIIREALDGAGTTAGR